MKKLLFALLVFVMALAGIFFIPLDSYSTNGCPGGRDVRLSLIKGDDLSKIREIEEGAEEKRRNLPHEMGCSIRTNYRLYLL